MRWYPNSLIEKLGFSEIRALLSGHCQTDEGREDAYALTPITDAGLIRTSLNQVREYMEIIQIESYKPPATGFEIAPLLVNAAVPGNWLGADECLTLLNWMRAVRALLVWFKAKPDRYPYLCELLSTLNIEPGIVKKLEHVIDDRGNIRDDASPRLPEIRRQMREVSAELRGVLHRTLRHAISQGWASEREITLRNDRYVIPMLADFKGRIQGFVHDVSQSGQTIFVEPTAALEFNNQLRQLNTLEGQEIIRILTEVTDAVREHIPALQNLLEAMGHLDLIQAKANLGISLNAVVPVIDAQGQLSEFRDAFHPLLLLKLRKEHRKPVPLQATLHTKQRILLISGPNAGGKSVTLKTIGLIQLMIQSGIPVPVQEGSSFRIFTNIFIDIGDEQSINADLSTYTSHLQTMKVMLDKMDGNSLFLLDEFGAGTDPAMGGAMAEALLQRFIEKGSFGVVTTHYGNLKRFADQADGICNAAMMFDPVTLNPTYELEIGVPGRSYAFEIARNVGIAEEIILDARSRMETRSVESDDLLLRLEEQRAELEHILTENRRQREELLNLVQKNRHLADEMERKRKAIIREAQEKAASMIAEANKKIEQTILEIRKHQAEKELTQKLRQQLQEMIPEVEPAPEAEIESFTEYTDPPAAGDFVKMKDSGNIGRLVQVQGNKGIVEAGDLRIAVKINKLVKIEMPTSNRKVTSNASVVTSEKRVSSTQQLDIRQMRVEQALPVVEKFLDDALLNGLTSLRILHGKGSGALREAIRTRLKKHPRVKHCQDAPHEQGGAGITDVSLR